MNKTLFMLCALLIPLILTSGGFAATKSNGKLTLIGHSSVKIVTADNAVVYIDPFYSGDYSEPADVILVTHGHSDHNNVNLVTKKDSTKIITFAEAIVDGKYQNWEYNGVKIQAVSAYNKNHRKEVCVGYILKFDDISLYHAGDTDVTEEMLDLKEKKLTYALFPTDGVYNMDAKTATGAANLVGAKYNIPIHTAVNNNPFNEAVAKSFTPDGAMIVPYGQTIQLTK